MLIDLDVGLVNLVGYAIPSLGAKPLHLRTSRTKSVSAMASGEGFLKCEPTYWFNLSDAPWPAYPLTI